MKRSKGLKRTPLKRKGGGLKRTPLKPVSDKRKKQIAKVSGPRKLYLEAKERCAVTGQMTSEVHEIARGPSRCTAVEDADVWLAVSRAGHEQLEDYSAWPIKKQIALKWLIVLESVSAHRAGRAQVSASEVIDELRSLLDSDSC